MLVPGKGKQITNATHAISVRFLWKIKTSKRFHLVCARTLNDDDAVCSVRSPGVGGDALVLAGVGGLGVDHLKRDNAVCVGDGELGRVQLLATLEPFDLE